MTYKTAPISSRLLELQTVDLEIREIRSRIESFGPLLKAVEEPAARLAKKVDRTSSQVEGLHAEERRLRHAAEDKRHRMAMLEDRLNQVKTVEQEAAVRSELGSVRRAADTEEQEVISLLDQIGRFEGRLEKERTALEEALSEIEPRREELDGEKVTSETKLSSLAELRDGLANEIDARYRRVYDNLIRGGRRVAVVPMTEDGACGECFSLIPLQIQNEIQTTSPLVLCEACGVILTAPSSGSGE